MLTKMRKNQHGDVVAIAIISVAFIAILGLSFWAIFSSKQRSNKILNSKTPQHVQTKENGEPKTTK
jgi:hypothetical protein